MEARGCGCSSNVKPWRLACVEAVKARVDRLGSEDPLDWGLWRLRVEAGVEAVEAVEAQVETVEARGKDVGCRGGEHWYVVGKSSVLS